MSSENSMTNEKANAHLRYRRLYRHKIKLYQRLYEFTNNQCGFCIQSGCACKDNICKHVEEQAARRGVSFQHTGHALRFIGTKGCVVPPHLRETCTIYLCEKAQKKPDFETAYYEKLKKVCFRLEWKLMELEEEHGSTLLKAPFENER